MGKEIVLERDLIKKNKIPILITDKTWQLLFNGYMTASIKKNADALSLLLLKEKEIRSQIREYQKSKNKKMKEILYFSNEVNKHESENALEKLEDAKQKILEINEALDDLVFELQIIPQKKEKLNIEILRETIQLAYKDIKEGNERIDRLAEEISVLRQQLIERRDEKIDLETRAETLYSYLHNTLGYEETDKLDKIFL